MPFGWFKKSLKFDVNTTSLDKEGFFVITAIFNPASYQSRYDLYHKFAYHMQETGAQLITVECIFPTLDQHTFQVTDAGNPNHIQLKSDSVYWLKENLINIAVSRLPPHAKYVCWLDADITFHEKNWVELTLKELKKFTVVQVFKKAKFLGPPPRNEVLRTDYSFGYSVIHNKVIDQNRYDEWYPHSGYGWAMDINAFRNIGGLPDYDIVGSGDLHFAFSLLDRVSNALESALNPDFKAFVLNHSKQTFRTLNEFSSTHNKKVVGYVPMSISHNWHGSRKDRQYVDRWKILIAHQFNYITDMVRNSDGLLQLISKPGWVGAGQTSLQEDILTHFQMRREDETRENEQDRKVTGGQKDKIKVIPVKMHGRRRSDDDSDWQRRGLQNPPGNYYYDPYIPQPDYPGDDGNCTPGDGHHHHPCPHPGDGHDHHHGHHDHHHDHHHDPCHDSGDHHHGDYGNDYNGSVHTTSHY